MAAAALSAIKGAGVDVSKVKASAHNGVVTLKGSVSTDSQVQAAATAVKSGSGVVTVKNKLRVRN
ncbi:lipoprotein [Caballeronia choica]|uniref:Lipoprotein n=1 Tax=Caballeronia choica TaxID=326476 RepID=A0A158L236_9BURK|nr:BON domain-containing protein [Caballeronia choica]SAL86711.1 lipoprotein [Caballeronia choica]